MVKKYVKDDLHRLLLEKVDAQLYYEATVEGIRFPDNEAQSDKVRCQAVGGGGTHRSGDRTPSLSINLYEGAHCFGCGLKASDIVWFHAQWFGLPIDAAKIDLYKKHIGMLLDDKLILKYRRKMRKNVKQARALAKRGVSLEMQKEFCVGWDEDMDRVVFPKKGLYIGYTDVAKITLKPKSFFIERGLKYNKKISEKGATQTIYPFIVEILDSNGSLVQGTVFDSDELVCVEGEIDALTCRSFSFNAVTMGGATIWGSRKTKEEILPRFRGKKVVIFLDNDKAGRNAAEKLYDNLKNIADKVIIITAPRGKDSSEYFMKQEGSADELRELIDAEFGDVDVFYEERTSIEETDLIEYEKLSELKTPEAYGNRAGVSAIVVGEMDEPYVLPKSVSVCCDRDAGQNLCRVCPNFARKGETKFLFSKYNPEAISFIEGTDVLFRSHFKKATGIPKMCENFEVERIETRTGQWVLIAPPLGSNSNQAKEDEMLAFNIGKRIEINKYCKLEGYVYHKRGNKNIFVITNWKPLANDYESFITPKPEEIQKLKKKFNPKKIRTKAIVEKLQEIAELISRNYSKIYHRSELHMAEMIRMHSALEINFDGQINNAYIETLIIGDTKQGKSAVIKSMQKLYNAGVYADGASVSKAGLVGGMMSNPQMFKTGALIQAHGTAFCIDESKDFIPTLETMKVVREGIYTYIKVIGSRQGKCQVRLCCLANDPRGLIGRRQYGCTAIVDLIPDPADISRFTYFLIVRKGDIPSVNKRKPKPLRTKITKEDFQNILLSCWSRKPDEILIKDSAVDECYKQAEKLSKRYSSSLHIVQETTQWHKLAQVATAIAGQQFNVNEDGSKLIVTKYHVRAARWWFDLIYQQHSSSYNEYSLREKRMSTIKNEKDLFKNVFKKEIDAAGSLEHCIEYLLDATLLTLDNVSDAFIQCNEVFEARKITKELVIQRAFKKTQKGYEYTEAFYKYLRKLKEEHL